MCASDVRVPGKAKQTKTNRGSLPLPAYRVVAFILWDIYGKSDSLSKLFSVTFQKQETQGLFCLNCKEKCRREGEKGKQSAEQRLMSGTRLGRAEAQL